MIFPETGSYSVAVPNDHQFSGPLALGLQIFVTGL